MIALPLLAILSGCASTQRIIEEDHSQESIVRVSTRGMGGLFGDDIRIQRVDDKQLGFFVGTIELLPGSYSFNIWHTTPPFGVPITFGFIDLTVEAGRSYQIEISRDFIWAVDQATDEVVAGVRPPG